MKQNWLDIEIIIYLDIDKLFYLKNLFGTEMKLIIERVNKYKVFV